MTFSSIYKLSALCLLVLLFGRINTSQAQDFDGRDFWVGFLSTYADAQQRFQLSIISDTAATVTITVPLAATPYTFTTTLTPNTLFTHTLPTNVVTNNDQSHTIRNTGIHIVSNADIIVYPGNNQPFSSDAATAVPTAALGTKYEVIAYSGISLNRFSTFNIVGTVDNTVINLKYNGWTALSNGNKRFDKGATETVTLDRGEVYSVIAYTAIPISPPEDINNISSDLTGTIIDASQPVAVYGGNVCAIAGDCPFCDHLFEQVRPTKSWGYKYNVTPTYKVPVVSSDIVKLYATENNTTINIQGQLPITLNAQQSYHFDIANPIYVESDKPIHVSTYLKGSTCNTPAGEIDPLMMDIIPENQYARKFLFGTSDYSRYGRHYATIIVETGAEGSVRLNGAPVPYLAPGPVVIPGSNFSMAYVQLSKGQSYTLTSTTGALMSVFAYGYGVEEAYGYSAGGKIIDLCFVQANDTLVCYGEQANLRGVNINTFTGEEIADNNILWFNVPSGGASVYSGQDITTTPIVTDTTILYAQVDNETCEDERYPVFVIGLPEVTTSIASDATICAGDSVDLTFSMTGVSNSFDIVYSDGTSNYNLNNIDSGFVQRLAPNATTTYTIVSAKDDSLTQCDANITNADVTITVNDAPSVSSFTRDCNPAQTHYTIEFDVSGGDQGSYTVDGLPGTFDLGGTHYTSNPISAGGVYSFEVYDANGCDTVRISGSYACGCGNSSGAMTNTTTTIEVCGNGNATATHDGSHSLGAEDKLVFYLHSGSGGFLSNPVDSAFSPSFTFGAGMTYGTTYYISPATADSNASGYLDRADPCFQVSPGTPVRFRENPVATINGTANICEGNSTDLIFNITGNGPFNVQYSDGTQTLTLNNINTGHLVPVSPNSTTTYTLTSVTTNNAGACSGTASGSVTITVSPAPSFTMNGTANACAGIPVSIPVGLTGVGPFDLTYNANSLSRSANGVNAGQDITETPVGNTTYTPTDVVDLGTGCSGTVSGSYVVNVVDMPIVTGVTETCDANDEFRVSFNISGGSGNYGVDGGSGTITAGVFTSDPMISGSSYQYFVFDDNNCDSIEVSGAFSCCEIAAGNMIDNGIVEGCETDFLSTQHDGNELITFTDILGFMLVEDENDPVGSLITLSTTASFTFVPGQMNYNQVYYVFPVATRRGPQGGVNLSSGCINIGEGYARVQFIQNPRATMSPTQAICKGEQGEIIVNVDGNGGPYDFEISDGNNSQTYSGQTAPYTYTASPFVTTNYSVVTVTDQSTGCTGTGVNQAPIIIEDPKADFTVVGELSTTATVSFVNQTPNLSSTLWQLPNDSEVSNQETVKFNFTEMGAGSWPVCLIITTEAPKYCVDTICKNIPIPEDMFVYIPNSFTPDGNELNQEFKPEIVGATSEGYSLQIFNRWGEKVFHTTDLNRGWDGVIHGTNKLVPTGIYVYEVSVKREDDPNVKTYTGTVTVLY